LRYIQKWTLIWTAITVEFTVFKEQFHKFGFAGI
jgi:hypothetical protein